MTGTHARLSIRIDLNDGRLGPGKIALLEAIERSGSISAAARSLKMSYARAWSLTEDMNRHFHDPLVMTHTGGNRRGGAELTAAGSRVLSLYRRIALAAERAAARDLKAIQALAN